MCSNVLVQSRYWQRWGSASYQHTITISTDMFLPLQESPNKNGLLIYYSVNGSFFRHLLLDPLFSNSFMGGTISSTEMYSFTWRMNIKITDLVWTLLFLQVKNALVCTCMQSSKVHLEKNIFKPNLISNSNKRKNVRYIPWAKRWLCHESFNAWWEIFQVSTYS